MTPFFGLLAGEFGSAELGAWLPARRPATFLHNALLESGHAVRYDGGAKEE